MYTDTITLFNRHKSGTVDMWYPTVLYNVNLNIDRASVIAKYGAESSGNAILGVKYHVVDGNKMIGDKIWLPPKKWASQNEDSLSTSLTFATGNEASFFIIGESECESPISDEEYRDGFYNYMNKSHDYAFSVVSVNGPYSVIPHLEIVAK